MGTSRETCPANIALVTMMAASALDQGLPEVIHFPFIIICRSRAACIPASSFVSSKNYALMSIKPIDRPTTPQGYTKPMRLAAALKFTFLTGVFQIGLGVFRLGAIVHYVSYPVMVACNSAGA